MSDLIRGIALAGFRSFPSSRLAILHRLSKVNLVVGQNNSGKSNVLRSTYNALGGQFASSAQLDAPQGEADPRLLTMFAYDTAVVSAAAGEDPVVKHMMDEFLGSAAISHGITGTAWFARSGVGLLGGLWSNQRQFIEEQLAALPYADVLNQSLTTTHYPGSPAENAWNLLEHLAKYLEPPRAGAYIEGNRTISSGGGDHYAYSGRGLIKKLASLERPSTANLGDRRIFQAFEAFVRVVMNDPTVEVRIPQDLETIHITQNGRTLPIEHLGTGIHEVIILAAAASVLQDQFVCIEEPEVHLHPVMQRQLLRYLNDHTSNQYLIATHSAHLLDSEIAAVFHVTLDETGSRVTRALSGRERAAICADLGYRPSDLVQANAVIWVEGPSDRIYLRHWIKTLAPELVEGMHYSIMFYGGSLLSELSPLDRDEVDEFISLKSLNRYTAVLIDSDRTSPQQELNPSKRRVIEGLDEDSATGLAWVTHGYTIENYVPVHVLDAAVERAHRSANTTMEPFTLHQNPLAPERTGVAKPSKTAIARIVVDAWPTEDWPLDLRDQVRKVVSFVKSANQIFPAIAGQAGAGAEL